jgi:RNA polymerase sigma-70 factor (ECF subfamily)
LPGARQTVSLFLVTTALDPASDLASRFATTRWDLVLASAETQAPGADDALSDLCRTYWRPLYAFVRRRGYSPADAEDLVQDFFAQFLHGRSVKKADPLRGRFRTFLLTSLQNFLANEWDRASAAKRGGKFQFVAFDHLASEERNALDAPDPASPEMAFDVRWARAIVDTALERLREEAAARGKGKVFDELKGFLTAADATSYETAAARLGIPLNAVKTAIHRLRGNFRTVVRQQVAQTVSSPTEIDEELRYLRAVLASAEGTLSSGI